MSTGWRKIEDLFFEALELPAAERAAWLRKATEGREDLVREVETLLDAHEASEAEPPVRRIGAYRLEKRIGRGGMGEVWLASRADGQFEQRVAIKLVRSGLGAEILLPRFHLERQLLARLEHPNIARLLDGGISAGARPYFVMEFVEGQPILDFCEHQALDARARIVLFRSLCGAVAYAHQHLIVHRDIKPGNVLVTAEGVPKLVDFGIAKIMDGDSGAVATAVPLMTPRYASPEQLRGLPETTSSDVYSLGVLLFEMLTGSLPYPLRSDTQAEMVTAITTQEARRASQTGDRVPAGDLDAILLKALEKDPARRYASVESFSADLENYIHGRPVSARTSTLSYRAAKYARRHWAGIAVAGVVAVTLGLAAAWSIRAAYVAGVERARSEHVEQFLEDMLGSVDHGWEGTAPVAGADTRLLDLLPSARERIASSFGGDPVAQARLHRALGRIYTNLQQYPEAEAELKAARGLLPSLSNDPEERARVLLASGWLDFLLSHRVEDEKELREAVATFERTSLVSDVTEHARYLAVLAEALADVGKKEESIQVAGRVAAMMEAAPQQSVKAGAVEGHLTLVYMKVGHMQSAETAARRSIALLASSAKPVDELAEMETWLGYIERALGNSAEARRAFERSVQDSLRADGPNNPKSLLPRIELAHQKVLDPEATAESAGDSIRELQGCLKEARAGADSGNLFGALVALGNALTRNGQPREGEALLREGIRVGGEYLSPAGPTMGTCDLYLGECLERQGRLKEARELYQVAYGNLHSYYGPIAVTRQAEARLRAASDPAATGAGEPHAVHAGLRPER